MDKLRRALAFALFDTGAIKFGKFKLALHKKNPNAPLSPFYIDLRVLQSFPEVIRGAADALVAKIKEAKLDPDRISGIPEAAIPLASLVMDRTWIPMITLRKSGKTHGISGKIMGMFRKGQVVLPIDDLVTRADTKIETIHALEANGLLVKDLLVLIDREQGGREQLKRAGYNLHAVLGIRELLALYQQRDKISQGLHREALAYLENF